MNDSAHSGPPPDVERLLVRFLAEAPKLADGGDLGAISAPVTPWPHQLAVVRRAVESYPQSFLFADEVGLGKTLEAGLALRQLWITERVRRVLILVPRAVLRQWQEELREKLALDVPRLEGRQVLDVFDREVPADEPSANLWNRHRILLASSQTARAAKRREHLLTATPWDLVIVDEAHHARRRTPRTDRFRPNRLLELLAGSPARDGDHRARRGLAQRTRCLYLLTATPMQVHPVEVWDLLCLLGLGGRWGNRPEPFIAFFEELRHPPPARDWRFLLTLLHDALASYASDLSIPEPLVPIVESLRASDLDSAVHRTRALGADDQQHLDRLLRRANPVKWWVFRHTRERLRRYRREGRLGLDVPEREPENVWIELTQNERALYRRIEAYLSRFYQRYEARRTGLGFVMTVYRRRLTSSFVAVRRSLERRRAWLAGRSESVAPAATEDWSDPLADGQRELFSDDLQDGDEPDFEAVGSKDEIEHLDAFLDSLRALDGDSKLDRLCADLDHLLEQRDRVLVFTQYTDTMDHLREHLRRRLAPGDAAATENVIACYSGRGGERWHAGSWSAWDKESLKDAFGDGAIRVLLCTEAASEGLNLQTCGVLVNYDMPWNPMRVEQRIGRIDRIGQQHPSVWIRNYFYADTVEATIYQRLADRIDWFRSVVGELQPILHRVGEAVADLALMPAARRAKPLAEELARLRRAIDHGPPDPVADDLEEPWPADAGSRRPATPADLETTLVSSRTLGHRFAPAKLAGTFTLSEPPGRPVTFRPEVFAQRPYSLDLLTWGTPRFQQLIAAVEAPDHTDDPAGIGLYRSWNPAPFSLFMVPEATAAGVREIGDLASLRQWLASPSRSWRPATEGQASVAFSKRRHSALRTANRVATRRRQAERRALIADAAEVVTLAAAAELVRAETPSLFEPPTRLDWGRDAVEAQARHGQPFDRLLEWLPADLAVYADEPLAMDLRGRSAADTERRLVANTARGHLLLERWQALDRADDEARRSAIEPSAGGLLERTFFLPNAPEDEDRPKLLEASEVEPFVDGVPCFDHLDEVRHWLVDAADEGRDAFAEVARDPAAVAWAEFTHHGRSISGHFAAPVSSDAFGRRAPRGSLAVFRLEARPPRAGTPVVVAHASGVAAGTWRAPTASAGHGSENPGLVLDVPHGRLTIDEPEAIEWVASLVAVLGPSDFEA